MKIQMQKVFLKNIYILFKLKNYDFVFILRGFVFVFFPNIQGFFFNNLTFFLLIKVIIGR